MTIVERLRKIMPQQICADDLDEWAAEIEILHSDPALVYCHRFAILMECVMLGGVDKYWNEMGGLLDEYNEAQNKWRGALGEPYVSGFGKD